MILYAVHDEDNEALVGAPAGYSKRRGGKKQPKVYTSERNARIAISNMYEKGQIVPYVAVNDPALITLLATYLPMEQWTAEKFVAELLMKFVKESEVNAKKKGGTQP